MSYKDLFGVDFSVTKIIDGRIAGYGIDIYFNGIINKAKQYLYHQVFINEKVKFSNRISFTAISHISVERGIIIKDDDQFVETLTSYGKIRNKKYLNYLFNQSEQVLVIERFLPSERTRQSESKKPSLNQLVIPLVSQEYVELLKIQSINIDFLNNKNKIFYRMSFDPLLDGVIYDTYMAT